MNNPVQNVISYGLRSRGYGEAKDAQRRVIEAYFAGRDVLMVAPTGTGKSLIFQIAPFCSTILSMANAKNRSVCLVVAPLLSLCMIKWMVSDRKVYQLFVWMPKHQKRLLIAFVVVSLNWSFVVRNR